MPRSIKPGEVVVIVTAKSQFKDRFGFAKLEHVQSATTNQHAVEVYGLYPAGPEDLGVWFMPSEIKIFWPK